MRRIGDFYCKQFTNWNLSILSSKVRKKVSWSPEQVMQAIVTDLSSILCFKHVPSALPVVSLILLSALWSERWPPLPITIVGRFAVFDKI